jgi:hypothetical protein
MFKLVKREGVKDENLAANFYSILLSTKTLMLFFVIRYTDAKAILLLFPYNYIYKIALGLIFILWYLVCRSYFLKNENYKRIVTLYESVYEGKNLRMALAGILYAIGTFVFFITVANFPIK